MSCESFAHKFVHIRIYDDLVNSGALEGYPKKCPKLDRCLHVLCQGERFSHII